MRNVEIQLVNVASFFESFADSSRLLGAFTAGQIHQTDLAHFLARHLTHRQTQPIIICFTCFLYTQLLCLSG